MNLKTVFYLLMVVFLTTSCSKESEEIQEATLKVSPQTSFKYTKKGGATTVYVTSSTEWDAKSDASWCVAKVKSGKIGTSTMDLIVSENKDYGTRNALINITYGNGKTETIDVSQEGVITVIPESKNLEVGSTAHTFKLTVSATGNYKTEISEKWIKKVESTRSLATGELTFEVEQNSSIASRTATIKFTLADVTEEVKVVQKGDFTPDMVGVESDAFELVAKMGIGWNLGNSLCAYNGSVPSETAWVPHKVNKDVIRSVKNAGFKSVRIPCAWNGYVDDVATNHIKDSWMNRVKEVVEYCIDEGLYAIINIHTDNNWLENKPFYSVQEANNKKLRDFWTQIATAFADYDEHVIFAGLNEVHYGYNTPTQEYIAVLKSYNQTFVDAVRATGGKNAYRNLIYQVYNTNINHGVQFNVNPKDVVDRRLIMEAHYYDPYEFAMTGSAWLWGAEFKGKTGYPTWGDEAYVDAQMAKLKTNFVDKGIPIIIGEYGVVFRNTFTGDKLTDHRKSWLNYLNYVTKAILKIGGVPMYWDNGWSGTGGEVFGLFHRGTGDVVFPDALQAIISAGK